MSESEFGPSFSLTLSRMTHSHFFCRFRGVENKEQPGSQVRHETLQKRNLRQLIKIIKYTHCARALNVAKSDSSHFLIFELYSVTPSAFDSLSLLLSSSHGALALFTGH